ncbi:hypothetical protein CMK17_12785, partial [Candidatus Poribacteria bacterium]|nr:hypothetical protein [Candidatus Poribacteria bacterium]
LQSRTTRTVPSMVKNRTRIPNFIVFTTKLCSAISSLTFHQLDFATIRFATIWIEKSKISYLKYIQLRYYSLFYDSKLSFSQLLVGYCI